MTKQQAHSIVDAIAEATHRALEYSWPREPAAIEASESQPETLQDQQQEPAPVTDNLRIGG